MAPRVKIYEENELFHAGEYLKVLEGSSHQPEENVLRIIKELFTLRKAAIASKYATLTFTGMVCDTQATLEVFFHDRHRSRWQITVTAYVGDYKKSIEDIEYCLSIGFPNFMDWVKSVIPYKRNLPLEPGQNAAPELWYETEPGKKFISQMKEIGFVSNLDIIRSVCEYLSTLIDPKMKHKDDMTPVRLSSMGISKSSRPAAISER